MSRLGLGLGLNRVKIDNDGGGDLPSPVAIYEADISEYSLVGSLITQWDDSSGNGNHLTQTNTSNQPTVNNGNVVFGANDFFLGLPPQNGDFTYVIKGVSFDVTSVRILTRNSFGAGDIRINSNGTARVINNDGQAILTTTGDVFSGSSLIVTKEGSNIAFYFDGIKVDEANDATGTFFMHKLGNQANSIQGTISGHVAVYNQALDDDQVASFSGLSKVFLLDENGNNLVDEFGNNLFSYELI